MVNFIQINSYALNLDKVLYINVYDRVDSSKGVHVEFNDNTSIVIVIDKDFKLDIPTKFNKELN